MLNELMTPAWVKKLAAPKMAKSAEKLVRSGAVRNVVLPEEDRATAEVAGDGGTYRVEITREGERIHWQCDCKLGKTGAFCEHTAALALQLTGAAAPAAKKAKPTTPIAQLREFLVELPREELRDILIAAAESDRQLKEQLLTRMRVARLRESFDEKEATESLLRAIRAGGAKVAYHEARTYIKPIRTLVNGLEDALDAGHAAAVRRICERTLLEFGLSLFKRVEDYGGDSGDRCLDDLVQLHFDACELAPPPARELAELLFRLAIEFPREDFLDSPNAYAILLGKEGLARIGELMKGEIPQGVGEFAEFRTSYLLTVGDYDSLIEIIADDIREPGDYTTLAKLCERAGRPEESALWFLLALAATAPSEKALREQVAKNLDAEKRAILLEGLRPFFAKIPTVENFCILRLLASFEGKWEALRAETIVAIRAGLEKEKAAAAADPEKRVDYSILALALLDAGDVEGAWQAARSGICREPLRLEVARARAASFPSESFDEFREAVLRALRTREVYSDSDAAGRLRELRVFAQAAEREDEFWEFVSKLRQDFNSRKPFLRLLPRP